MCVVAARSTLRWAPVMSSSHTSAAEVVQMRSWHRCAVGLVLGVSLTACGSTVSGTQQQAAGSSTNTGLGGAAASDTTGDALGAPGSTSGTALGSGATGGSGAGTGSTA